MKINLGNDFIYGTATSSYQIEGAYNEGGRGPSIWDTFSKIPGRVLNSHNGDVACDHYHLYKEDILLMKQLGISSYQFSIAWPRIFPRKKYFNQEGMYFYINLAQSLIEVGIKPVVALYHWDLPQWAQDEGGWTNREVLHWFDEFSRTCFEHLDTYADMWITHNEPWCSAFLSYDLGLHAPGYTDMYKAVQAAHHILLSHGRVVKILKEDMQSSTPIGIVLNLTPTYAESDSIEDQLAQNNSDGYNNRWFLDAVFKGSYPKDMMNLFSKQVPNWEFIHPEDMAIIAVPCDFFGINYYSRHLTKYCASHPHLYNMAYSDYPKTGMDWDIAPQAFKEMLLRVRKEYTQLPIYITENGSAWDDGVQNNRINDVERIEYLELHLQVVSELNEQGGNIKGYYVWSLLDNFEWSFGYEKRFGIVYVDFETQTRIPKDSYYRYQEIIAETLKK